MADALTGLPRVREWHGVTRAVLDDEIIPAGRPAVLRGVVADWPLVRSRPDRATLAHALAALDSGKPVETFVAPAAIGGRFFYNDDLSGFNFDKRPIPVAATVRKLVEQADASDPIAVYAGAAVTEEHVPGFARSHPMPLLDPEVRARIWIGNAVKIAPHYDMSLNIACVLAGRRRFTFFPPEQVANLYVGPFERTMAGPPASLVDPDAPDFDRFPRFAEALEAAEVGELEPGDAVYIPPMWWHGVRSFSPLNVLVNYWWGEQAHPPLNALMHALLAIRDLPATERSAWKAFFDHYVFETGVDAGAHLPPAVQGVIGPASSRRTASLVTFLQRTLNR